MNTYPGDSKAKTRVPPTRLSVLSDEDLVERLAGGCHDSLAVLFDRYYRLVLGIASTVLRDPVEAEDVLQTVFLEICRVAGLFDRSKGKAKTWLIRYAYHRSLDRLRQLKLRGFYDPAGDIERQRSTENSSGASLPGWNSLELSRMLEEAFAALTAEQRTTLHLAFVEGRSMREIAEQLGATFTSVRHHYYRGLEKLRSFLTVQITPSPVERGSEEESPYVES
jgi:RNA polymerase sigma-70 factor (ECF subfamily)